MQIGGSQACSFKLDLTLTLDIKILTESLVVWTSKYLFTNWACVALHEYILSCFKLSETNVIQLLVRGSFLMAAFLFIYRHIPSRNEQESKHGDVDASILYTILPIIFHMFSLQFWHCYVLASTVLCCVQHQLIFSMTFSQLCVLLGFYLFFLCLCIYVCVGGNYKLPRRKETKREESGEVTCTRWQVKRLGKWSFFHQVKIKI